MRQTITLERMEQHALVRIAGGSHYLIVDIADILLAFPVHIENFQKSFVDSLICGKSCLQAGYKIAACRQVSGCSTRLRCNMSTLILFT